MGIIDRAYSGFKRTAGRINKFGNSRQGNKLFMGINNGLKSIGSAAKVANSIYDIALQSDLIPQSQFGKNTSSILTTLGKLEY